MMVIRIKMHGVISFSFSFRERENTLQCDYVYFFCNVFFVRRVCLYKL